MRSGSRKRRRPGLLLVLVGFVSVVASVVILAWPVHGAVALAALVGGFAVEYGILLAVLALRLRNAAQATTEPFPAPASPDRIADRRSTCPLEPTSRQPPRSGMGAATGLVRPKSGPLLPGGTTCSTTAAADDSMRLSADAARGPSPAAALHTLRPAIDSGVLGDCGRHRDRGLRDHQ